MKKIFALCVSIAVILSFAGCGKKSNEDTSNEDTSTASANNSSTQQSSLSGSSDSSDEYFSSEITSEGKLSDVKIGDYVVYTPERSKYVTNGKENNNSPQTFYTMYTKWICIGKSDNGGILITSYDPVNTLEESQFKLYGVGGYLYGEEELNAACKKLYSSKIGDARSMNLNDILTILNYKGPKGCYTETGKGEVETDTPLKISDIEKSSGKTIERRTTPDSSIVFDNCLSDGFTIEKSSKKISTDNIDYVFRTNNFWLASSCIEAELPGNFGGGSATFLMRRVNGEKVGAAGLFVSYDKPDEHEFKAGIRPVVEINQSAKCGKNTDGQWVVTE